MIKAPVILIYVVDIAKYAKSKFQEQAQSKAEVTPLYKVLDEYGPTRSAVVL